MQEKYKLDSETAGKLYSVTWIISMVTSPFLGYFVDKYGKRVIVIGISSLVLIIAFSLSMFLPSNNDEAKKDISELYVLILVGIAYSIYAAALWGSIPYVADPAKIGTAYGICTSI